jgi:hypothetical protein
MGVMWVVEKMKKLKTSRGAAENKAEKPEATVTPYAYKRCWWQVNGAGAEFRNLQYSGVTGRA